MSHKSLTKRGYVLKKKNLTPKEERRIIKLLSFQPLVMPAFQQLARPKKFYTYLESQKRYYLPRYFGIQDFGAPEENQLALTGQKADFKMFWDVLPHQEAAWSALQKTFGDTTGGGILSLPCGYGKCLGKNTPVMMYDGTIKMVQDVRAGDLLMGDDSTPRTVLGTCTGREKLYHMTPINGTADSYIANESHILCLKFNKSCKFNKKNYQKGDVLEITIQELMKIKNANNPDNNKLEYEIIDKHVYGYQTSVKFDSKPIKKNPYYVGVQSCISNNMLPLEYKCNSSRVRFALLAGIIDTIGISDDYNINLNQCNFNLIKDIIYLIRSLGLIINNQTFRLSGSKILMIPTKKYKYLFKSLKNLKKTILIDELMVKLEYQDLGVGDYYGFELDGNGRFLLGDFQVTHNTSLAIRTSAWLGLKTIVVVHKEFLLKQWKSVIEECTNARVGIIQRDKVEVEGKDIVIAMLHSLVMRKNPYPESTFQDFGMVIYDECHHLGSEMFSKSLQLTASRYTLGLSATPRRKDGLTQVFLNYLGPMFHQEKRSGNNDVWVKFLEVESESAHFDLEMNQHTGTKDTGKMITNISKFDAANHLILELCRLLVKDKPRKVLVLGARREQLEWLSQAWNELSYKNCKNKYATGGLYYGNLRMNKKLYWDMLEKSAKCDIIWGTNDIAKEGLDIKDLNTLVMLNGGQDVEQSVGRILRKFHKEVPPTVIDIVYKCGNFPKHANVRRDYYTSENYVMQKMKIRITDDEDSVYQHTDKLDAFIKRYPERGGPGTIKPKKSAKKEEIPLANRPPELKPIVLADVSFSQAKQKLNLTKKVKKNLPSIAVMPELAQRKEGAEYDSDQEERMNSEATVNLGWSGYDSDEDQGGIYDSNRGDRKGRLYLNDSDGEEKIPSLKELVINNINENKIVNNEDLIVNNENKIVNDEDLIVNNENKIVNEKKDLTVVDEPIIGSTSSPKSKVVEPLYGITKPPTRKNKIVSYNKKTDIPIGLMISNKKKTNIKKRPTVLCDW